MYQPTKPDPQYLTCRVPAAAQSRPYWGSTGCASSTTPTSEAVGPVSAPAAESCQVIAACVCRQAQASTSRACAAVGHSHKPHLNSFRRSHMRSWLHSSSTSTVQCACMLAGILGPLPPLSHNVRLARPPQQRHNKRTDRTPPHTHTHAPHPCRLDGLHLQPAHLQQQRRVGQHCHLGRWAAAGRRPSQCGFGGGGCVRGPVTPVVLPRNTGAAACASGTSHRCCLTFQSHGVHHSCARSQATIQYNSTIQGNNATESGERGGQLKMGTYNWQLLA